MFVPCSSPSSLVEMLVEDYGKTEKINRENVVKRYEGWILYFITKGGVKEIVDLARDILWISVLDVEDIVQLFEGFKSEIIVTVEASFVFDFKARKTLEGLGLPRRKNNGEDEENNREKLVESVEERKDVRENPGSIEKNYEIDEFYLEETGFQKEISNFSKTTKASQRKPCSCNGQSSCSRHYSCICSRFYLKSFGMQRAFLIVNGKKYLPRDWKEDFYIVDCVSQCSCEKIHCFLTFFDGENEFKSLSGIHIIENYYKTTRHFLRGEFLLEISGNLQEIPNEECIQLSETFFLNVSMSNLIHVRDQPLCNTIPVKIFTYFNENLVCRLVLFASSSILPGEELVLDFNKLCKAK